MNIGIHIPNSEDDRVQAAFGDVLNLGQPATQREIEQATFSWVEQTTHDYERRQNMSAFTPDPISGVTFD